MQLVNDTDQLNLDTDAKATGPNGPCGAHACFDQADPTDPGDRTASSTSATSARSAATAPCSASWSAPPTTTSATSSSASTAAASPYLGVVGCGLQGQRLHRAAGAAGRLLRDRLRRPRARPPVRRQPHLQRRAVRLLRRQPRARRVRRARVRLVGDGVRRHLPAGRPAAAHRPVLQPAHHRGGHRLHRRNDPPVTEVQTVSLRGFDTDGEQIVAGLPRRRRHRDADPRRDVQRRRHRGRGREADRRAT